MSQNLTSIKRKLSSKYLGKGGVHAFGMRRAANTLYVYIDESLAAGEQRGVLRQIEQEARPFKLVTIYSKRARFA
jgi:hypothetical protein